MTKLRTREEFPRTTEQRKSPTTEREIFGRQDYYPDKDTLDEERICVDRMGDDCERRFPVKEKRENYERADVASVEDSEQRKGKLRRKAIYMANGPLKRRKNQGTNHYSEANANRSIALYELGKNRVTLNRELAATRLKDNRVIVNIGSAKNGRITALYELGKNRVIVNRELAAIKPKVNTVVIVTKLGRPSARIVGLYELGKHRVMTNRDMAVTKLHTNDNWAAHVAALSDTEVGTSEIAGHRLYTQAQQSAEKKYKLRQIARSTPPPQMKLATQQRNNKKYINWGTSPIERYFALHEEGTNRIAADRDLETRISENKTKASNEGRKAGYASMRQMELYEMGTKRLLGERLNQKSDTKLDIDPHYKLGTPIVANATMIKLYKMSTEMQENGKKHCEEIASGKEQMNISIKLTARPSKDIAPNATMINCMQYPS